MARKILPDQAYLLQCLAYDPGTGVLTWRTRPPEHFLREPDHRTWNTKYAGQEAGVTTNTGHRLLCIDYGRYLAHRVIWKMTTGEEPPLVLDHCNMVGRDNRRENIREATFSQNLQNRKTNKNNRNGLKGITFNKKHNVFRARIHLDRREIHLGIFATANEAYASYCTAARILFGEFWNDGHLIADAPDVDST